MLPQMIGSQRRWEKELRLKSKAACDRLGLEIELTSRSAQSKMAQLGMIGTCSKDRRLLVIQLIQDHNRVDVYRLLHQSSGIVNQNASKFISSKSIPDDKDLVSAMANIIFGAARLSSLVEVEALASFFRTIYGEKFFVSARNNNFSGACIVNPRVVTKLTHPIQESLVDQYLKAIVAQPVKTENPKVPMAPTNTYNGTKNASMPSKAPSPIIKSTLNRPNSLSEQHHTSISSASSSSSSVVSMSKLAPTLPIRIFRPNQRLEIAFDVRTKNPIYVMERLDGSELIKGATIRHPFYEEERLPLEYRSRLCSYIRSGYDRGHMAAAANFGAESVRDTFNLCNVSPQDQAMNRSTWFQLEHWCRKVAERELLQTSNQKVIVPADGRKSVHIVTGPVWLPTMTNQTPSGQQPQQQQQQFEYSAIGKGDALVHVPTHFFKIIVVSSKAGGVVEKIQKFACFLVPNLKPKTGASLEEYFVHWDRLEAITGLQFFPHLATPTWKAAVQKVTASIISSGRKNNAKGVSPRTSKGCAASLATQLEHLRI